MDYWMISSRGIYYAISQGRLWGGGGAIAHEEVLPVIIFEATERLLRGS